MQRDDEMRAPGPAALAPGAALDQGAAALGALAEELARLRRALLKQGHAQELFQERLEQQVEKLANRIGAGVGPQPRAASGEGPLPNPAQQRVLLELDQAVLHLLRLARGEDAPAGRRESDPHTVQEGLGLLQIRVRNLQRSFGLEPIPAVGQPFDDRLHQADGVCHRADLPDGQVVEELLPGYRLGGRVLRTALVVVNRRP